MPCDTPHSRVNRYAAEMADERWLRPGEVAERWGVDRTSVARIAKRMRVASKRLPGEARYAADDVERAYQEMTRPPS